MALTEPTAGRTIDEAAFAIKLTLAEACKRGDLLGYSSGWKRALATVGTAIQARFVAAEDGVSGDVITAFGNVKMSGYSGGTPGAAVYAAEGTSYGCVTETAPTTTGDCNTIIGIILSATEIVLTPGYRVPSLA